MATPTRSQLAEQAIRQLVRDGAPGDRLPGESELAKRLATSRVTVRDALSRLWHAGLVVRRWGAGTFIADPADHALPGSTYVGLDQVGSLPQRLTAAGFRVELSHFSMRPADWPGWLNRLDGTSDGAITRVQRCLRVNDEPAIVLHDYLPQTIDGRPGPDPHELAAIDHDLPGLFRRSGFRIVKDEAILTAALVDAELAEPLETAPGAAVLRARQRSLSETGDVVTCAEAYYRDDVYRTTLVRVISE